MAFEKYRKDYMKLQFVVFGVFVTGILTSVAFLIASITEHWVFLTPAVPVYIKSKYMIEWRRSIWRDCLLEYQNISVEETRWTCFGKNFFPSDKYIEEDDETDYSILDYTRSVAAFSVLTLILSSLPIFFSWYSIKEPRYIFKRLAGGLYFITAGCGIVCVEVFKRYLEYGKLYLPRSTMKHVNRQYGISYYSACVCIGFYCLCGVVIIAVSGKKKGPRARSMKEAEENEPVIIGRL